MLSALTNLDGYCSNNSLNAAQLLSIGDLDHSGAVSNADLQSLLNLIATAGSGSIAPVPEPATLVLASIGTFVGLCQFRRRREQAP
jgi:hypothetical protein